MNKSKIIGGLSIAGTIISLIALFTSIKSCRIAEKSQRTADNSYELSQEIYEIQYIPKLTAQIYGQSYVGPIQGRIDEVVTIPIIVSNNSDAFAHNIILDLLISDGTGREISLNDYFKSENLPIMYKDRLAPGEQWLMLSSKAKALSAPVNAKEIYASGSKKFKAKLQLSWKDAKGKNYRFINLEELKYAVIEDEVVYESFWFESKEVYNSRDNNEGLEKNWGLNFNY